MPADRLRGRKPHLSVAQDARLRRDALLRSYVGDQVVDHIISDGRVPLPSGVRLPLTVLFADLCGFTRLADALPAERVVRMLDDYFAAMTAAAVAHGAVIDKFIGDAIMLLYGVPTAQGDEATRAICTAREMHERFSSLVRQWRQAGQLRRHIGLAIGIASGDAVLANVGSAVRMDYTVIGTAVNLAARLTTAARSGVTLVSAAVRQQVHNEQQIGVRFGSRRTLRLKGFVGPITAYTCRPTTRRPHRLRPQSIEDPVCGMKVDPVHALMVSHRHRLYYFCSPACRAKFRRSPQVYLSATA